METYEANSPPTEDPNGQLNVESSNQTPINYKYTLPFKKP